MLEICCWLFSLHHGLIIIGVTYVTIDILRGIIYACFLISPICFEDKYQGMQPIGEGQNGTVSLGSTSEHYLSQIFWDVFFKQPALIILIQVLELFVDTGLIVGVLINNLLLLCVWLYKAFFVLIMYFCLILSFLFAFRYYLWSFLLIVIFALELYFAIVGLFYCIYLRADNESYA